MWHKYIWIFTSVIVFLASGCSEETRQRLEPTPIAVGSLNQLAVIADQELWDSNIGDSIRYYFGSAYPILPQPEPLFDLKHFTPTALIGEPTRKELKAYLVVSDLSDLNSSTTEMVTKDMGSEKIQRAQEDNTFHSIVVKNKWAKNQVLVYLFADGKKSLAEVMVSRFPAAAKVIQQHYDKQIDATAYLGGTNNTIIKAVQANLGFYLKIPSDFVIATSENNTMWLRRESDEVSSNLILYKLNYQNQNQFDKEQIINLRDTLGKYLISTTLPGTYMRTNDKDLPVFIQKIELSNAYAVEARGIWEMQGEFMGGPFISYLVLNEKNNELVFIDAFVFAPSKRKRNYMLQLDHIVSSLKL